MTKTFLHTIIYLSFLAACTQLPHETNHNDDQTGVSSEAVSEIALVDTIDSRADQDAGIPSIEQKIEAMGLINIMQLDSSIYVDLKYSGLDNFLSRDLYGKLENCFLQPEVAQMLVIAQQCIKAKDPELSLVVYDCARPVSVQEEMWEYVKGTDMQKYVAPPKYGSMHAHGAAVDLSIVDAYGLSLDMGTDYDHFGPMAQPRHEIDYLRKGELTNKQLQNRYLLRRCMKHAGFHGILNEWWHFNAFSKSFIRENYPMVP